MSPENRKTGKENIGQGSLLPPPEPALGAGMAEEVEGGFYKPVSKELTAGQQDRITKLGHVDTALDLLERRSKARANARNTRRGRYAIEKAGEESGGNYDFNKENRLSRVSEKSRKGAIDLTCASKEAFAAYLGIETYRDTTVRANRAKGVVEEVPVIRTTDEECQAELDQRFSSFVDKYGGSGKTAAEKRIDQHDKIQAEIQNIRDA